MLRFEVVWISGSNGTLAVSYETSFMGPRNVVRGTSRKEEYARVRTAPVPKSRRVTTRNNENGNKERESSTTHLWMGGSKSIIGGWFSQHPPSLLLEFGR